MRIGVPKIIEELTSVWRKQIGAVPGKATKAVLQTESTSYRLLKFTRESVTVEEGESVLENLKVNLVESDEIAWLQINGINTGVLFPALKSLNIHDLVIEDIVSPKQRAKLDEHEGFQYIFAKDFRHSDGQLEFYPVSLIVGNGYMITIEIPENSTFVHVRKRLENNQGRVRKRSTYYFLFCLLDSLIDNVRLNLHYLEEAVFSLEDELASGKENDDFFERINENKQVTSIAWRNAWPLKELISKLRNSARELIDKKDVVFYKDLSDHVLECLDGIEMARQQLSDLATNYQTRLSHRLNRAMKTITRISAVFVPMSFIAGIYGMNFAHMPELKWDYGYYFGLGLMAFCGAAVFITLKIRGL